MANWRKSHIKWGSLVLEGLHLDVLKVDACDVCERQVAKTAGAIYVDYMIIAAQWQYRHITGRAVDPPFICFC